VDFRVVDPIKQGLKDAASAITGSRPVHVAFYGDVPAVDENYRCSLAGAPVEKATGDETYGDLAALAGNLLLGPVAREDMAREAAGATGDAETAGAVLQRSVPAADRMTARLFSSFCKKAEAVAEEQRLLGGLFDETHEPAPPAGE
jgi:hypothetical protein